MKRITVIIALLVIHLILVLYSTALTSEWKDAEKFFFENPDSPFNSEYIGGFHRFNNRQDGGYRISKSDIGKFEKLLTERGYMIPEGEEDIWTLRFRASEKLTPYLRQRYDRFLFRQTINVAKRVLNQIVKEGILELSPLYGTTKFYRIEFMYKLAITNPDFEFVLVDPNKIFKGYVILAKDPLTERWKVPKDSDFELPTEEEDKNLVVKEREPEAQYQLGLKYYIGRELPKDTDMAFKWFVKSAEQEYAEAQNMVAAFYAVSKDPTRRNGEKAVYYALKAVAQKPKQWNFQQFPF